MPDLVKELEICTGSDIQQAGIVKREENTMKRRTFFGTIAAVGLVLSLGTPAFAEGLESLNIIVPAKPGGGWDQTGRALEGVIRANSLAGSVSVENVAGAGGTVGLSQLASKEAGNGNAVMITGLVMVGAVLTNNSPTTLEQVTPLARLTGEYEVVVVPVSSPIKTMGELVEKLKADPGAVAWGGGSAGGTDHIIAGLIGKSAGIDLTKLNYVPFSGGGEALAAILGGHVTAGISGYSEWEGQIAAGELRVLGITAPERVAGIDAPTLKEQGVDVELANWRGIVAAPGISETQKATLADAIDKAVKSDAWKAVLAEKKWTDLYLPGDDFGKLITSENARVTETLKSIGLVQ